MTGTSPLRGRSAPGSVEARSAVDEKVRLSGSAGAVLSRHAEQTALLVASAVAPQTFVRSLGPRSLGDQAVVTGVVTALSYAATVATQDALTSLVSAWSSRSGRTDARPVLLFVNAAVVPLGLGLARVLPVHDDERAVRGLLRQSAWRSAVTGLAGVL